LASRSSTISNSHGPQKRCRTVSGIGSGPG
jgi:hypothetical protein